MTLRARIIGYFAAGLAITLLATTIVFSVYSAREIRSTLTAERIALTHSIDHAVETGLRDEFEGDFAGFVQDRLDQITSDGNFYAGVVYDSELTPLLLVSTKASEAPVLGAAELAALDATDKNAVAETFYVDGAPLSGILSVLSADGDVFGYVALFYDNAAVNAQIRRTSYFFLSVALVALILGGGVFGYFLIRLVSPLSELTRHTIEMGADNFSRRVEYQNRRDEIGNLARALEKFRGHAIENKKLSAEREQREVWLAVSLEETRQANELLKEQKRELNELAAKADQASRAKSEFIANMSHEIRTPMNGVLGIAEVLMASDLKDDQRELASIIVSSGAALMHIINDILDFSKIESGKLELHEAPFDLRSLIDDITAMMQARAVKKNLELVIRYDPDIPGSFIGDEARIRQALTNLIGNAIKFTDKGHVLVDISGDAREDKFALRIAVEDTGVGIAQKDLSRVFEKFEQADASKARKFEGTGLGLPITKSLIEMMGGEVSVESELGRGSKFTITLTLPAVEAEAREALLAEAADVFNGARILAVEDNKVNRRILCEIFDLWRLRYEVVDSARSAMEALERSYRECDRFHLIMSDFHMPEEDGESLCARIQADRRFASIPAVLLSSSQEFFEIRDRAKAKFAAHLAKPIRAPQLLDTLSNVLQATASGQVRAAANALAEKSFSRDRNKSAESGPATMLVNGRKPKILIAEDNVVNQQVIRAIIGADDFDLLITENGAVAVDKFLEFAPDLIFMDLSMPVMDGYEATEKIRELEKRHEMSRTPVLAATAHAQDVDQQKCFDAGMDGVITKPIRKQAIDNAIAKWLGERRLRAG